MTKTFEWWRSTSIHIWRLYFATKQTGTYGMLTATTKRQYDACERIYVTRFGQSDQALLEAYYNHTKWGDDRYAVEDYSARTGLGVDYIWRTIKLANRYIAEEVGLLEKKR